MSHKLARGVRGRVDTYRLRPPTSDPSHNLGVSQGGSLLVGKVADYTYQMKGLFSVCVRICSRRAFLLTKMRLQSVSVQEKNILYILFEQILL